jgi:hypothetical protein
MGQVNLNKEISNMMDKGQIEDRILDLLADSRVADKSANLLTNAPLAIIQLALEVEINTLEKVLGVTPTNFKRLRGEL